MNKVYHFDETAVPFSLIVLVFFINLLFFFFWIRVKQKNGFKVTLKDYSMLAFFVIFSVLYCLGNDYFRYREWVEDGYSIWYSKEPVYPILIDFVNNPKYTYPYELFRFIIWGGALLATFLSTLILKLRPYIMFILLFLLFYNIYCYARGTLGMAILTLGLIVFLKGTSNKLYYVLGLLICLSSIFFHLQMLIAILLIPVVFLPFQKKSLMFFIPLIIVGTVALFFLINKISILGDIIMARAEAFIDSEEQDDTVKLSHIMGYSIFYISFILVSLKVKYLDKNNLEERKILFLYRFVYGLIVSASSSLFVFSIGSPIFYRTLFMSMIPLIFLLTFFYERGLLKKQVMTIFLSYALLFHSIGILVRLR